MARRARAVRLRDARGHRDARDGHRDGHPGTRTGAALRVREAWRSRLRPARPVLGTRVFYWDISRLTCFIRSIDGLQTVATLAVCHRHCTEKRDPNSNDFQVSSAANRGTTSGRNIQWKEFEGNHPTRTRPMKFPGITMEIPMKSISSVESSQLPVNVFNWRSKRHEGSDLTKRRLKSHDCSLRTRARRRRCARREGARRGAVRHGT